MTITLSMEKVILCVLAILAVILLIYLILLVKKLIGTLKMFDGILADMKVVSATTAEKVEKADEIIDGVGDSVNTVINNIRGNQSLVAAATNFVNASSAFAGIVKGTNDRFKFKKRKNK